MRKTTQYKVSGVLETKPTHLPEGLEVEEVEVTLPRETIDIIPIHGGSGIRVAEYDLEDTTFTAPGVMIGRNGIYDGSEVRRLRDFLNLILGEENNMRCRVVKDREGDVWFELAPDEYTLGGSEVDQEALKKAKKKLVEGYGYRQKSFNWLNRHEYFGPVAHIDNTWEG